MNCKRLAEFLCIRVKTWTGFHWFLGVSKYYTCPKRFCLIYECVLNFSANWGLEQQHLSAHQILQLLDQFYLEINWVSGVIISKFDMISYTSLYLVHFGILNYYLIEFQQSNPN